MIRTITIAALLLILAAPAFAQSEQERERMADRINTNAQIRKLATRGLAANERIIDNGKANDADLVDVETVVGEVAATVTEWKQLSNPEAWIAGIGASLAGIAGVGWLFKRGRDAKQGAEALMQQVLSLGGEPVAEAGKRPFRYAPPAAGGRTGSGTIRGTHSGGSSGGHADEQHLAVKPPNAMPAPTESGTYEIPPGVRIRMGGTTGGNGH